MADLFESLSTRIEPSFDFDTYKMLRSYFKDLPRDTEIVKLP